VSIVVNTNFTKAAWPVVLTAAGLRQARIKDSASACGRLVTGGDHWDTSPGEISEVKSPGEITWGKHRKRSPGEITGRRITRGEDHRGEIT